MTVSVSPVEHPSVAAPTRGLGPCTPSTTRSPALAGPTGDPHAEVLP